MNTMADQEITASDPVACTPFLLHAGEQKGLGLILLAVFALATCFMGLAGGPPMGDHECINALQVREAFQTEKWLIPLSEGAEWIRKPPMGTWLIGLSSLLLDPANRQQISEFVARLPSAVAGFLTVWVMYWLGRLMWGYRVGLIAGFISAGTVGLIFYSRNALVDMTMTFFVCLAYACFWRGVMHEPRSKRFMALFYVAFAAAWMSKAPLPGAIIGLPLAVFWFIMVPALRAADGSAGFLTSFIRQCKDLGRLWLIPGIVLFIVLGLSWWVYAYFKVPNALELWETEFFDRYVGGLRPKSKPFWYYLPLILGMCAPYMLSVPESVGALFMKRYQAQRPGIAFVWTWAVVGTVFVSSSQFKQPHYLISVLPAYWLLLAPVVERLFFGPTLVSKRAMEAACNMLVIGLLLGVSGAGIFVFREYPAYILIYLPVALGTWLLWAYACRAYARERRILAFGFLQASVLVIVCFIWPTIGLVITTNAEADALAAGFKAHSVTPSDRIIWVDNRPDAKVGYYSGLRIGRLMNEMEITAYRENRTDVPDDLKWEMVSRIEEELNQPEPVYMIMDIENYEMLLAAIPRLPARELFRLTGFNPRKPGADLLVFTQKSVATRPVESDPAP
ncbi:MAG: glycosyltransferase family 39 protein [Phycisphaerales bacterium]|nr:glycosyltransferase family 39 protein [Phycisphaerales bacterium]